MVPADDGREVRVVDSETVYDGYFRVDRYLLQHSLHGGGLGQVVSREVFERGHVVGLLPVDLRNDQVVLIEQFRPGALAAGWEAWLWECVAGVIEPGEQPDEVARRECSEETGLTVGRLELVARYLNSPGACSETMHLFVGEVDAGAAGGVFGLADEGEDILVKAMSVTDALNELEAGRIVNSKTVIALQWLALHHDDLRSRWLA